MKFFEYMASVRPSGGLTYAEAAIAGIEYPLVSGWVEKYKDVEIDDCKFLAMQTIAALKKDKKVASPAAPEPKQKTKAQRRKAKRKEKAAILKAASTPAKPRKKPKEWTPIPARMSREFLASPEFLQSYEWRRLRLVVIKKYGAQCQCCGASPSTGAVINVDHVKPRKTHPELALTLSNLQVLCGACNHGKGNWDRTDWRVRDQDGICEAQYSLQYVNELLKSF